MLDADACFRALRAKDRRFDGLFFVGVSSTRIYCRCVCSARTPKPENCRFFGTAAEAEREGYRPCLVCRPELAPGSARVDVAHRLAAAAFRLIQDGALDELSLSELAEELGVSERHLRRSLVEKYGITPVELAQTQRLLTAKRLLTDTQLRVGGIAMASGFSSVRRFNALFHERYRIAPSEFRRRSPKTQESVGCEIAYRPPYDWNRILAFLGDRSIAGVERVHKGRYWRTAGKGWLSVAFAPGRHALQVQVSPALLPKLPWVLRRVSALFDTAAEPGAIEEALGGLALPRPGLRLPGSFDGFETAVRAVLGQQITVAAARGAASRFVAAFGTPVETPLEDLHLAFPTAATVAALPVEGIAELGIFRSRAGAIVGLAEAVRERRLRLCPGAEPEAARRKLLEIPGIGEWTAQYILMRALSYPDAFPHRDVAVLNAMGGCSPREALERAERWRPWRSYAVMHLWSSLS
jgi:AraC family transcriptional regulator, regulatory protein of adaptative response / DNA-3-methyladenine glycosylase II